MRKVVLEATSSSDEALSNSVSKESNGQGLDDASGTNPHVSNENTHAAPAKKKRKKRSGKKGKAKDAVAT